MPKFITRRRFLTILGATALSTAAYANRIEPHRVTVVHRNLPITALPAGLDGKCLVQISDLHVGPTDDDYLLGCLGRVADLHPELIVITGDYMTGPGTAEIEHVARVLAQLKHPPLGVIGTFGNHDYSQTWKDATVADQLAPVLTDLGIKMLRNEWVDVAGLQVIGMDELWAGQFRPEEALAGYDPTRGVLSLSHNPDTVDRSGWGKYQGWILSGHTHGGQCKFPFLRPPIVPVRNKRYVAGEYDLGDGRRLYINRGLGYNRRVRFNMRPEITAFALRRVEKRA